MKAVFWNKTRYIVLLFLVGLITISFHPAIILRGKMGGLESGNILSPYILLVFIILFVICFDIKTMLQPKVIRTLWLIYSLIALSFLITFVFFKNRSLFSDLRSIAICLISIMIGWQIKIDEIRFKRLLLLFGGTAILMGFINVMRNIGGFQIMEYSLTEGKNSLGVLLATSSMIFFMFGINRPHGLKKWMYYFLTVAAIVISLTIRARTATVTMGLVIFYILYQKHRRKDLLAYALLGIIVLFLVFIALPDSVKSYVFDSFTLNQGEDITSGRMRRNAYAIRFFSQHPLLGNFVIKEEQPWVHNYPLDKLSRYGFLFSLPILAIYLYILFYDVRKILKCKTLSIYSIGYFALIVPYVVSMAEPTLPFGPGTATVFNFILFGIALKNDKISRSPLNNVDIYAYEETQS